MTTITKDQFNTVIDTFTLTKTCSVKPDADGESKTVHLKIKFEGATVNALAQSCLSQGVVVKWQNGRGRKIWTQLENNQSVDINWSAPAAAPQVDAKTQMLMDAKAAGVDIHDKVALMEWLDNQF